MRRLFLVLTLAACDPLAQARFGHDESAAKETPKTSTDATSADADGGVAALPARDPFEDAPAFATIRPSTVTTDHHLGDSNAGSDCLACHGKNMGAPPFVLAGTILERATDAAGAAGVEVRVVDPDGKEVASVGTDENGNFWLSGAATFPPGSSVGIRDGSGTQKMSARIGSGACNTAGCHTRARPIFLAK